MEARIFFGVFRVKNDDFTPKNHIFSNFRGARRVPPPLGSAPGSLRVHLMHLISIMSFKLSHVSIPKRRTVSPLFLFCANDSSVLQNFKIFTHLFFHFSCGTLLMTEVEFESSACELRI